MTAVDTNILVRFLVKDDRAQYESASEIFRSNEVFIPRTVVLETEWVLRHVYEFSSDEILGSFKRLFGLSNIHTEDFQIMAEAVSMAENGLDFADALHLASSKGVEKFVSFDKALVKKAASLTRIKIEIPSIRRTS
jgi:predicted nucleic-acid-binding protein